MTLSTCCRHSSTNRTNLCVLWWKSRLLSVRPSSGKTVHKPKFCQIKKCLFLPPLSSLKRCKRYFNTLYIYIYIYLLLWAFSWEFRKKVTTHCAIAVITTGPRQVVRYVALPDLMSRPSTERGRVHKINCFMFHSIAMDQELDTKLKGFPVPHARGL